MKAKKIATLFMFICLGITACGYGSEDAFSETLVETMSNSGKDREESEEENIDKSSAADPLDPYVLVQEVQNDNMPLILYDYNEYGDLTQIQKFYDRGDGPVLEYVYEYINEYPDDGGRITVRNYKMVADGEPEDSAIWEYEEEYDDQNRLVRKTTIKDGNFTPGMEVSYEYNSEGYLIRKSGQDSERAGYDLTETYEYDTDGNMVKLTVWNDDESIESWRLFYYDENGRQTLWEIYKPDGTLDERMTETVWQYTYDDQGHIIEEKEMAPSGGTIQHTTYKYDEMGGLREKTDLTHKITYEYLPLSEYLQGK